MTKWIFPPKDLDNSFNANCCVLRKDIPLNTMSAKVDQCRQLLGDISNASAIVTVTRNV